MGCLAKMVNTVLAGTFAGNLLVHTAAVWKAGPVWSFDFWTNGVYAVAGARSGR